MKAVVPSLCLIISPYWTSLLGLPQITGSHPINDMLPTFLFDVTSKNSNSLCFRTTIRSFHAVPNNPFSCLGSFPTDNTTPSANERIVLESNFLALIKSLSLTFVVIHNRRRTKCLPAVKLDVHGSSIPNSSNDVGHAERYCHPNSSVSFFLTYIKSCKLLHPANDNIERLYGARLIGNIVVGSLVRRSLTTENFGGDMPFLSVTVTHSST